MQKFFDYLDKIKNQSPKVKQRIAFFVSVAIILIIISIWLPLRDNGKEEVEPEQRKVIYSSENSSWDDAKAGFRKVINALQTLKDFKPQKEQ